MQRMTSMDRFKKCMGLSHCKIIAAKSAIAAAHFARMSGSLTDSEKFKRIGKSVEVT